MKTSFPCWLFPFLGCIPTFLFLAVPPLPAQIENADFNMSRTRDAATGAITYGFEASVEGPEIRQATLVTPLSKTFVLFDSPDTMANTSLSLWTDATNMSQAFFTSNFPNGLYKLRVTFEDASIQEISWSVTQDWPDFPTVLYPASGATNVSNAPLVQWTKTNGAAGYWMNFQAMNYIHELRRRNLAPERTSALFPEGTLLMGDTYEMLLTAQNNVLRSATRVTFGAAAAPQGPALKSMVNPKYLVGITKQGTDGYQLHTEVRPAASGYSRFQIVFPATMPRSAVVFESPLAANPFQVWASVDVGAPLFATGVHTMNLRHDNSSVTPVNVTVPSQYPADPTITAPTAGQAVPPGYLAQWQAGAGVAPDAFMREVNLDKWGVSSIVLPSVTQAVIPAFDPTMSPIEDAELTLMSMKFQISGAIAGFTASGAKTEFKIVYPTGADGGAWTLYR